MASRGIKFKVWQGVDEQFYAHVIAGNNKITWVSEGYPEARLAHKNCKNTWKAVLHTIADGGLEPSTFAVPYTKDSLLP